MIQELSAREARRIFDPKSLGIKSTEDLKPLEGIIGQKRAVSALHFGLGIQDAGFNIYVAGPHGIGKMTAVRSFLEDLARRKENPPDWCYANNFDDAYQPKVFKLPPGRGRRLQQDVKDMISHVRAELPKAFDSEEYSARRDEIVAALNKERETTQGNMSKRASELGFALQTVPYGIVMIPVLGGHPLSDAEMASLPVSAKEEIQQHRETLQAELKAALKETRELERTTQERLRDLDRQVAHYIVDGVVEDLTEKYLDCPEVAEYLGAVQKDILENIETLKTGATPAPAAPKTEEETPVPTPWARELSFRKYQVNVLVDNGQREGAPVVVEMNPSYNNLFGRIEKETQFGALYTDFTMIKAGSLHRANGGYLVVRVEDLLRNPLSWEGLKRALLSHEIQIEEMGERLGFAATRSLRPQPIPLQVKVVLVGHPLPYYILHANDDEFPELFKVKADFDVRMDRNDENVREFVQFIRTFCDKEKVKHLDSGAVAKVLEHASRLAEDQEKLSTHFGALGDVLREAQFWALQDDASHITALHVRKALDEKVYRSNLIQELIQEMIARGTLLIDTTSKVTGQVNGLSVISLGDYAFGRPSRITASVGPGRQGITDIEREVQLGGPIHSKGVLILSGYLVQNFAQDRPLSLAARLVFEQSYEGIEGDSASCAELYALLSALADLPIKQGTAVTGSVNQQGEVQAIGGVNQKIEGYFDVCKAQGLTGEQGVMIPSSNVQSLMLREDVVEAVKAERFHVWAVKTIDEGIEFLTSVPAGERGPKGEFTPGSVNHRVEQRLRAFAERLREFPELGIAAPAAARTAPKRTARRQKGTKPL